MNKNNMKKTISKMTFLSFVILFIFMSNVKDVSAAGLNYKTKSILITESFQLFADSDSSVTFSSSNKKVASVNAKGLVTGKKKGTAVITAKTGTKKLTCKVVVKDTVDLIVFAGQSNMTGIGDANNAPKLLDGSGYECKTVTDPKNLSPIVEPFGAYQNTPNMNDYELRTGSLVTAFANSYYKQTQTPIIGVCATLNGTGRVSWSTIHYKEVVRRYNVACKSLKSKKIKVRHSYLVFMQGENDGFNQTDGGDYIDSMQAMMTRIQKKSKIESCLMVRIGTYREQPKLFDKIIKAQTKLCQSDKRFVLVSTKAASLDTSYYREDGLHIQQAGLNIIGAEAGSNAGKYAKTGREPSIKDSYNKNTYKSNSNE